MHDHKSEIEFTLKGSIVPPWKLLFFSFPFIFLNPSPLSFLSFSLPYFPQSSPPSPYFNFAS